MTFLCLHFVINEVERQLCLDVYEVLAHILCPFSYWCTHLSYSFARALFIIEMSTFTICSPIYHLSLT